MQLASWFSTKGLANKPYHIAAAVLVVALGALFYWPYLSRMPSGYHSWAQGDRLALAINFYDYGFNFWKPRTSDIGSIGGVTGVEFPLQAYMAAVGGLLFGRSSINTVFRVLDVSVTLLGFFYLFRLIFERTNHFVAALVPACFLLSSASFVFYAGNYLPDPFSLSLSFVGYYYWLRFFDERHFRHLAVGIVVLTLASLIKTTTALFLISAMAIVIGWCYFQPELLTRRQKMWFVALAASSVSAIAGFFYHNQQLNTYHQATLFLSELRPITDSDMFHHTWRALKGYVGTESATRTQQRVIWACVALFLVFLLPNLRRRLPLVLLVGAAVPIAYAFFWQMGSQLIVHDYYTICSFAPLAVLLLLLALLNLGSYRGWYKWATSIGLAALSILMVRDGYQRLHKRMAEQDYAWLQGSSQQLTEHGIAPTTNIYVLGDPAPNTSLVCADRRGLVWSEVAGMSPDLMANLMARHNIEYVVMHHAVYHDSLATQHAAWNEVFAPVMKTPFVVMRLRNMNRPW
ncbi:glycosyltransferase family 39 protein [Hymenobacter tibetensis]|uniref:Glycosyltransferase family 39 protein n=1 Tax=Hymenobacter tibetensis TaxID=497967 RepID=A0ABY4CW88_9BACT|nr:glycosyltransferase family 39 protein [Hymenobacter tibetensis]UOG73749.1 glycosyltransferase family 39 protein [Hymenobacter tibetensis]